MDDEKLTIGRRITCNWTEIGESGGRIAGVEVKAGSTVRSDDFRGLRRLKEAASERFAAGVVLYDGSAVVGFGDGLHAVPLSALWESA